jgi:hypothetical protein
MTKSKMLQIIATSMGVLVINGCAETQSPQAIITASNQPTPLQNQPETVAALPPPPPIVNSRNVSLTDLNLDNQGRQIIVKPGKTVPVTLNYAYNCPNCKPELGNQIIVGLANRSAQACIYDGGAQGQGSANFELKVPVKPGKYEIRFRILQAANCAEALKAGWGADNSPAKENTIGRIIASKRAENPANPAST